MDLIGQLEQLDTDNQRNVEEIMSIKDKLLEENNKLKDKYEQLQQINKKHVQKEAQLKKSLEDLKTHTEPTKKQTIIEENRKLKEEQEETKKEMLVLKSSNATLQKVVEDFKKSENSSEDIVRQLQAENKIIYSELQSAKVLISDFEKKSIEDAENCSKLAAILESYEKQVSSLKEELKIKEDPSVSQESIKANYSKQLSEVTKHNEALTSEIEALKTDCEKKQATLDDLLDKKEEIHKKYVNIVTESVKRYTNGDIKSEREQSSLDEDLHIAEFSKQIENIMEILSDFKTKSEDYEKKMFELTQEKNNLITEKNHEIEKLIQNSDVLTQEIINKSQVIKEYENECNELEKNNELLLKELETYKNNSGLQTITETNEENVVMLEAQLEASQKRISYLEGVIEDYKKTTQENDSSVSAKAQLTVSDKRIQELEKMVQDLETAKEGAMKKLSVVNTELENKSKEYQELINKYDNIMIENDRLREDVSILEDDLETLRQTNDDLTINLDKIKSDFENSDYQLSEQNINMDGLKEELERCKKEISRLCKEKESIEQTQKEVENNNENLRTELNFTREQLLMEEDLRKQDDQQVQTLTEKLQSSKMIETTLKLQCDTLNKEIANLGEAKRNLEDQLAKSGEYLQQYETNYLQLEQETNLLKEKTKTLEELKAAKEEVEEKGTQSEATVVEEQELVKSVVPKNEATADDCKLKEELDKIITEKTDLAAKIIVLQATIQKHLKDNNQLKLDITTLQKELEVLNTSRNELINLVKTKDQESFTYYNEIQRLTQILRTESDKSITLEAQLNEAKQHGTSKEEVEALKTENEKLTDQNNFLRQKCEVLAENLLQEQSKVQAILSEKSTTSDREVALSKELDRLKSHLIEVEETLTQELVEAEQKNADLLNKFKDIQEREKNSSTMYTSISIRANQQVEVLQKQVQSLTSQREELRKKVSDCEDENNKKAAALANLQFVLEQFQKGKKSLLYILISII